MRYVKFFLVWFLFFLLVSPALAIDEDTLMQKVASNFERLIAKSKIQEPTTEVETPLIT